jgi:hypothetical protein
VGLKESLKELQKKEREYEKLSLKREVKKELTKIKRTALASQKKCVMCNESAMYSIKGSNDWFCRDCAIENFGSLGHLKKIHAMADDKR